MSHRGNPGISASNIGDVMPEAVEARFGSMRAAKPVEMLSYNGAAYTLHKTRTLARQLNLKSCFTAVCSPQCNGISEAFAHILKTMISEPRRSLMRSSHRYPSPNESKI